MQDKRVAAREWRRRMGWWAGFALLAALLLAALPARAERPSAVVLGLPGDPYAPLAQEISAQEGLPLALNLEEALATGAEAVIWVVAPGQLSEELLAQVGHTLAAEREVVLGLISGGTLEASRALWQRQPATNDLYAAAVPREGTIETYDGTGRMGSVALTQPALIEALAITTLFSYQGHGSRREWHPEEEMHLTAEDVPPLDGQVINADACQTTKLWGEGSIALAFADQGAAAYIGFLHSPIGYMMGEPKGFALRHTWPAYPIGHLTRVQARGMAQGHIAWPYLLVLGNPLNALSEEPPYRVVSDVIAGPTRTVALADLPAGVVPVRITEGTRYPYVHIPGVGRAYRGDPFYDDRVQMADLGEHKYLLVKQGGGALEIRLRETVPWWWPVADALMGALDHTGVLHHVQGSLAPSLLLAAVTLIAVAVRLARRKEERRAYWRAALAAGLALTLLRVGYALARQADLAAMYESYLRTMDLAWEVNPVIALANALTAVGGAWLLLGTRRWWGKVLAALLMPSPTTLLAGFWLAVNLGLNLMAQGMYGGPLYGYGMPVLLGVATLIEASAALLSLCLARGSVTHKPSPAG